MNDSIASVLRQRGKVLVLFILCGTAVALVHREAIGSIFAALSAPVAAFVAVGEWASAREYMQDGTK